MSNWFKQLDQILRGDATRLSNLRDGRIETPMGGLAVVVVLLACTYGLCMGAFAVVRSLATEGVVIHDAWMQVLASTVKLPLLLFLTLLVTLPSLYVFNALVGSRLTLRSVIRLLVAMLAVMTAVLASLGPIVVFFAISTTSYSFMKLLNVAMATVAGVLALAFLLRTLHRLVMMQDEKDFPLLDHVQTESETKTEEGETPPTSPPEERRVKSALDPVYSPTARKAWAVFRIWVVVFALVGAQMSWVLRPFIGNPSQTFSWFRQRESNFFLDVLRSLADLFGG